MTPSSQTGGVARGAFWIALILGGGKALAMIRDAVLTRIFPDASVLDSLFLALLPVSMAVGVVGVAAGAALLPIRTRVRERDGLAAAARLTRKTLFAATWAGLALVILAWVAAPAFIELIGRRLEPERRGEAVTYLRLLLPYLVLAIQNAVLAAELNGERRFAWPAALTMLPVGGTLVGLLVASGGLTAYVIGMNLGSGAQFLILLLLTRPVAEEPGADAHPERGEELRDVGRQFLPLAMNAATTAGVTFIDQAMAAAWVAGGISALVLGGKPSAVLLTLTAMALGTASMAYFSDLLARNERDTLRRTVVELCAAAAWVGLPLMLLMILIAEPLVRLLYGAELAGSSVGRDAALVLAVYAPRAFLVPAGIVGARVLSAAQFNRVLLGISLMRLVVNVGGNVIGLRLAGIPGVAAATVVADLLAFVVMLHLLRRYDFLPDAAESLEALRTAPGRLAGRFANLASRK